ncbi:MAG: ankyrin repeat domain-containing protein [bacterium]|nr:ankyrin repeat domain-containing protein [bacterium]
MFYDEIKAIEACCDEPSLIFELIKEGHFEVVDKILSKNKEFINTIDEFGNNVLMRLLKRGQYDLVLKYMKSKELDINHQNYEGNTFAHLLVSINYVHVLEIIKTLVKNKRFMPNIKNNKGETILDKSINENYIYTTVKILEDKRFNNIDIVSFKNLYETYIESKNYGSYSKLNNLEIIIENLDEKSLMPNMKRLIELIKENYEYIKERLLNNKSTGINDIINDVIQAI